MHPLSKRIDTTLFVGLLILITVLPFHAFLRTWLTALTTDSTVDTLSHSALIIASWKEILVIGLVLLLGIRVLLDRRMPFRITRIETIMGILMLLGIALYPAHNTPLSQWLFGFRTDFAFFAVYLIARSITFSKHRFATLVYALLISGGIVVVFGLLLKFVLPQDFLLQFGYSPYVSSYVDYKPIPMYHCEFTGDECIPRLASTVSGPNQYGTYLIILASMLIGLLAHMKKDSALSESSILFNPGFMIGFLLATLVSMYYTYSQGAWISMAFVLIAVVVALTKNARLLVRDAVIAGIVLLIGIAAFQPWQYLPRIEDPSTIGHVERFREGLDIIADNPFGLGLGEAGPVSERFEGDKQGIISESWYLQITQELGIVGGILFIILCACIIQACWRAARDVSTPLVRSVALATLISFIGVCVNAIVLHSWADSTTAWTLFIFIGITVQQLHTAQPVTSVLKSKGVAAFGSGKLQ